MAFVAFDLTVHNGDIGFLQMTSLELKPEMALGGLILGEDHHARGGHIQPVNGQCVWVGVSQPSFDAVRFRFSGNRKQAGRFIDEDQVLIFPQNFNGLRN